jgi:predicted amidohydrolase
MLGCGAHRASGEHQKVELFTDTLPQLRFPEIALHHRRRGAETLLYPSAFASETGAVHWMPLLQARAIESQSWVIAAAQVGAHNSKRTSWGHSVIISPWGEIKAECSGEKQEEPELATAEIELGLVEKVRGQIPWEHRRTDVYAEV